MIEMVVVLYLTIWDADTGERLAETVQRSALADGVHDLIEECRKYGVSVGTAQALEWRADGHPNAFANVNCHWERATI